MKVSRIMQRSPGAIVLGAALAMTAPGLTSAQAPQIEGAELLPPNAKPGECYARIFVPPTYRPETEQVLKRDASERVEIIPARYENVTE